MITAWSGSNSPCIQLQTYLGAQYDSVSTPAEDYVQMIVGLI